MALASSFYEESKQMCLLNANSFSYAAKYLNEDKRNAAYALYGFCRYTDNILDEQDAREAKQRALTEWKKELETGWEKHHSKNAILHAFVHTCVEYGIPRELGFALINSLEMDLDLQTIPNFEELNDYCYGAGGIPGIFMSFVCHTPKEAQNYAVQLGIAMQLTNILRDIKEDLAQNRIYLPQDELRQFHLTREQLQRGHVDENFIQFMRFQISRAKKYYAEAEKGFPFLEKDAQLAMRLCLFFYREILIEIEKRNYDVFSQRVFVSLARKEELVKEAQRLSIISNAN